MFDYIFYVHYNISHLWEIKLSALLKYTFYCTKSLLCKLNLLNRFLNLKITIVRMLCLIFIKKIYMAKHQWRKITLTVLSKGT